MISFAIQDHDLIKNHRILCLNKLDSKELYIIQLLAKFLEPTSQAYFENVFVGYVFEWKNIYILPIIVKTDSRVRIFQYKILYLNKKLFQFNKISSPEHSFCKCEEKTPIHLFYIYWNKQASEAHLTTHLN